VKVILLLFITNARLYSDDSMTVLMIEISGNTKVDSDAILMNIKSKEGGIYSQSAVSLDVKNIFKMGYFESVSAEIEETEGGVILRFVVQEKQYVRSFEISGNDEIETEKINEAIKIKPRTFLDEVALQKSIEAIQQLYIEEGLFLSEIKTEFVDLGNKDITIRFKIDEGEKVKVKEIKFSGVNEEESKEIKSTLETREYGFFSWLTSSGKYNKNQLAADVFNVESYFMDRGYINVKVSDPVITLSPDRRWLFIVINVFKGDRFKISHIDLTGDLIFEKSEMLKEIKSKEGEYFNRSLIRDDIFNLTDLYGHLGYANANINPLTRVDPDRKTIDLTLNIDKNKLVYIDKIHITGNTKTRDKVVRREIKLAEGELYNIDRIKFSRERIYALGFFEEVSFSMKPHDDSTLTDLYINVKEGHTGTFTLGAGFSSIDKFIFTTQTSFGNFLGYGQRVSLRAELSSRRQLADLSFYEPYFLDTDWSFGLRLYTTEFSYVFQKKSTGGDLKWGYKVGEFSRFFVEYKYEDVNIKDIGATDTRLFTSGVTSSVTFSIVRNSLDHPYDPARGSLINGSMEVAGKYLGGDFDFYKFDTSYSKYVPLFFKTVFLFKAQAGYGRSITNERLPFSERYFVGGPYDVRGYDYWTVGPMASVMSLNDEPNSTTLKKPIGGNKMVVFNAEYIFNIIRSAGIKGVFFFDAGNAFSEEQDFFEKELRLSWGFGIRWFTPIAPFRFEWGFPIKRRPGEKASVFEFSIGSFF
jgi:outer membrane protein insertion porin family